MERLHILDGYGYIFRAYYGMAGGGNRGASLSNTDGLPTGALHVYASMLVRMHHDLRPDRIVVVFDAPGKNFRFLLDPNYKATRKETPEDLKKQMPYFRPLTEAFCWPVIAAEGVEADDTIATITGQARERGWDVVIYSGDKDLMQLVDERVTVVDSMRRIRYDSDRVVEKFGVRPDQLGDWLSLVGDKSDNVPGMVGVGKVGATKLLNQYGDLRGILRNIDELKGKQQQRFCDPVNIAQLELSKKLVTLKCDVELGVPLESFVPTPWDSKPLEKLCEEFGFSNIVGRLSAKGGGSRTGASAAAIVAAEMPEPEPKPIKSIEFTPLVAEVVMDGERIAVELAAVRKAKSIALVVESDGTGHDRERLVGLGISVAGRTPIYVPVAHRYLGAPSRLSGDDLAAIALVLADPDIAILCHDSKTIQKILKRESMSLAGVEMDYLLADSLLDPGSAVQSASDALAKLSGVPLAGRESLIGKGKRAVSWEMVEVGHAASQVGPLLCALLAARESVEQELSDTNMSGLCRDMELPLAILLAEIEDNGISLDLDVLNQLRDELSSRIAAIESRAFELAGGPFNLGSPKQLSILLFDTLGLRSPIMKKTKTGHSTDHEVLEAMVSTHKIIEPILEHRELIKLKGTYVDALPPLVNPNTKRLHTSFRQDVAATGRLSSQEPNLQNIPIRTEIGRSIRQAFVAPEGMKLISADYSQIELRIMAHLSEDPMLVDAFARGVDVHSQTAAAVFDVPVAEVVSEQRRVAKAVNYGLIYGQSEFGLSRSLGISKGEAGKHIRRYFERFSKVREFMDEVVESARIKGAAYTVCGRKRPIPGLLSKNFRLRSAAERIAQNTPMQGSAADIMKLAMLKVGALLHASDSGAKIILTVHDELVIEVKDELASELCASVKDAMESAFTLRVPLVVDTGLAQNWADAH